MCGNTKRKEICFLPGDYSSYMGMCIFRASQVIESIKNIFQVSEKDIID